ncbi:DNA adenine methylase [Jiella pelagia]|uniref:site-specific DNA-methyltransferase (adenine-specific) n=1 Tax=Jiella pelagia TaxID=2986949 RepID=A0ABY7C3H3_9HYPH|nr:DNA adenine methylase [Jiella pelagia]WAP70578.1 DNA adenine methylase [Jiella pelagia]
MAGFTYMGTKKTLAGTIDALCGSFDPGPFMDLFSGISAAGSAIAPKRQIWCNDAQIFSRTLTEALYLSREEGPRVDHVRSAIMMRGNDNLNLLARKARGEVEEELDALWSRDAKRQIALQSAQMDCTTARRTEWQALHSHCLFTTLYAGTYLGLVQAMQVDSIRFGADASLAAGVITAEEHSWALLSICRAVAATSNSTGHFAQYLTASDANIKRVIDKRRRCVWSFWSDALCVLKPIGDVDWRAENRVFHGDAVDVLQSMSECAERPAIIYADPPYTNDQYSRFYHLLETVLLYDYPAIDGKGQYRQGRFRSSFSLATKVDGAFKKMIAGAARVGSDLMISYPSDGLFVDSLERIPALIANHFAEVYDPIVIPHHHSTMGGSKGAQKEDVEECIFIGRRPLQAA